jgi:hypothetical protein
MLSEGTPWSPLKWYQVGVMRYVCVLISQNRVERNLVRVVPVSVCVYV